MMQIKACLVAEYLSLQEWKEKTALVHKGASACYFSTEPGRYYAIYEYGVIAFAGMEEEAQNLVFEQIRKVFPDILLPYASAATLSVKTGGQIIFEQDTLMLEDTSFETMRIVLDGLSSDLLLTHYEGASEQMMLENRQFVDELKSKGRLGVTQKELLFFAGNVLDIKTDFLNRLHLIEEPFYENTHHHPLKKLLDERYSLIARFRKINRRFQVMEERLRTFTTIVQHRDSSTLEWIIILLIMIEIVALFMELMLKIH